MVKPQRILSIDYGMARIGLAISDERQIIATPLKTLLADKKSEKTVKAVIAEIEKIAQEYGCEIQEIVIGLPLMMNGKMGSIADEVTHFANLMKTHTPIPITMWDERLTSVQAERSLRESGMSRKGRTKHVDAVAAVIILQNYLDMQYIKKQITD